VNSVASTLESAQSEQPELELSIILPARNEELNLPACLTSLLSQSEPGFALGQQWELIIVNDDSTDRTVQIAQEAAANHPGVTLINAPTLDQRGGFTGKSNACWAAAQIARGGHLLFTDADTIHEPGDLSRSLREAERHGTALLSYSPRQIVKGFWQHATMPLIFSELASIYPPKLVNDPKRRVAAANGQFLLVERDAYFAVGGHRAAGNTVLEDVALANAIKRSRRDIRLRYAPEALSTRMYRSLPEMINGWTKNLALLCPKPMALAAWRILDVLLYFGLPAAALGIYWLQPWQRGVILVIWARTLWRFYARVARSGFPAADVALSILGVPLLVYLLLLSTFRHRIQKSVVWKGRSYKTAR
jgi:cellulose synthase/poly-beta-1,6-N-acetylglucosamine synthase-like glycosyltransferase